MIFHPPAVRPSRAWRRSALLVPGLTLVGIVGLLFVNNRLTWQSDAERAVCHALPMPWIVFASAYLALACGLAALLICWARFRAARLRGWRASASWQGNLAGTACIVDGFAVFIQFLLVYGTHYDAHQTFQCATVSLSLLPGLA